MCVRDLFRERERKRKKEREVDIIHKIYANYSQSCPMQNSQKNTTKKPSKKGLGRFSPKQLLRLIVRPDDSNNNTCTIDKSNSIYILNYLKDDSNKILKKK